MKASSIIYIVFLMSVAHAVRSQEKISSLSLPQAVDIAIKNNIQVRQSELRVNGADLNRRQARANLLPTVNGDFNYGWNNGRSIDPFQNVYVNQQLTGSNAAVSGSLPLFNGLQLRNLIRQNTLNHEAAKMDLQQNKETLTMNVILNYLQVLSNEDLIINLKNQASVTRTQLGRLETLVKEGAVGLFQLSDMKGQLANDEVAIINATNNAELSKLALCQLLNVPFNKSLTLERNDAPMPTEIYPGEPDQIFDIARKQLALVKAGELRVESAKKAVDVEKGAFLPRIGLYGNLFSNYSSAATTNVQTGVSDVQTDNYVLLNNLKTPVYSPQQQYQSADIAYGNQMKNNVGSSFGLGAQVPIFNNLRTRYRVAQARVNEKNAALEKSLIELNLRQQIDQAYVNMQASYHRYKAYQNQYNEYSESFRANEIRFNTGVINSFEYLSAKNNLDRAQLNLTQVRYEYIFRTWILDYYQGKLSF